MSNVMTTLVKQEVLSKAQVLEALLNRLHTMRSNPMIPTEEADGCADAYNLVEQMEPNDIWHTGTVPKDARCVLALRKHGESRIYCIAYYTDRQWWHNGEGEVIAWMELPEFVEVES